MSDVLQVESNERVAAAEVPVASYNVVPYSSKSNEEDLFAFRATINEAQQQEQVVAAKEQEAKAKGSLLPTIGIAAVALVLALLFVFALPQLIKPKSSVQYNDLGNRRLDAAGLSGRLIARWEGKTGGFQFFIDPLDPSQAARFQAVALNPPHPISFVLLLRNASGLVSCQKEIDLPDPVPQGESPDPGQKLVPRTTATGDTVQNVIGGDGQIAEITVSGSLPCSKSKYDGLTAWDFTSNFPTEGEQEAWLKQQKDANKSHHGQSGDETGYSARAQRLPAPIDGDDVIVGDNPTRGTVDTGSGLVFLVGVNALRNRGAEWQFFPAAIHFRCDKNGLCALTRTSSHTTLQARLIK